MPVFAKECNQDKDFLEVGEPSHWGSTTPTEGDRICNEYGSCIIPIYEYLLSTLGVRLLFNAFEVSVFNHLIVSHS